MKRIGETTTFKDRNLKLQGADIATRRDWTGVPNFILESDQISVGPKLTYAILLNHASIAYTKRYLCITDDELQAVVERLNL